MPGAKGKQYRMQQQKEQIQEGQEVLAFPCFLQLDTRYGIYPTMITRLIHIPL